MGMDLLSQSGAEMRFSGRGWTLVLNIAEAYGWQPAGTLPPADWSGPDEWPGNYDSNEGQTVTTADAGRLAESLDRALEDEQQLEEVYEEIYRGLLRAIEGITDPEAEVEPLTNEALVHIEDFVSFCHEGSFTIW